MSDLETIRLEIYTRANYLNGRYSKADFGLTDIDISSGEAEEIKRRADFVDEIINRAQIEGCDVDDVKELQRIAESIGGKKYTVRDDNESVKTFLAAIYTLVIIIAGLIFLVNLFSGT